jgi:hypothetical protein
MNTHGHTNSDTIVLALLDALTSKVNINYISIQTTYLVLQDTYGCSNLALFLLTALYLRTTSPQDTYISHILWNATSFFTLKNLQRLLRTLSLKDAYITIIFINDFTFKVKLSGS